MPKLGVVYNTGRDQWQHGQETYGRHVFLGPCPLCGNRTFDYGGGWACLGTYCSLNANQWPSLVKPQPAWWNTDINVKLDGDSWRATRVAFVDLQESIVGYGETPAKAVESLLAGESIRPRRVTIEITDALVDAVASAAWKTNAPNAMLALLRAVDPGNKVIQIRDREAREHGYVRCDSDEVLRAEPA